MPDSQRERIRRGVIQLGEALEKLAKLSEDERNARELDAQIATVEGMLKAFPFCADPEIEKLAFKPKHK